MRRIVLLSLLLGLAGCGYNTWDKLPFISGSNPNLPAGDSENMRRAMGQVANVEPLTPEPGDVWPGPIKPPPTLQDLESQSRAAGAAAAGAAADGQQHAAASHTAEHPPLPSGRRPSGDIARRSPTATGQPNTMAPPPGRAGLPDQQGSGGIDRRHQQLPDASPRRAAASRSWCRTAMAPARSSIRTARSRPCPLRSDAAAWQMATPH